MAIHGINGRGNLKYMNEEPMSECMKAYLVLWGNCKTYENKYEAALDAWNTAWNLQQAKIDRLEARISELERKLGYRKGIL
jgi:hypothetical protein